MLPINKSESISRDFILQKVERLTSTFEPITLVEMDNVKLMDRVDVKYILPLQALPQILADAQSHYRILEVENKRLCHYETLYYDTPDLQLYNTHLKNRANRYKIRSRNYVDSDLKFFEIKLRNNKGRTIKTRIRQETIGAEIDQASADFLKHSTPLMATAFKGMVWVDYTRITLVSRKSQERLTIDLNLSFRAGDRHSAFDKIAIAEVKQNKATGSAFIDIMKKSQIRQGSISKYCLAVISTFDNIPCNQFKPHLLRIHKLNNQYDIASGINQYA
ncbi:polyphosphate polymerase domain-containing protein [Emticicia sp. 21SJ11W-3]|uniref:polyphosphate polymerase domain-containing protein n=1 Tax=Emticicia sp. 21SJ11W-3 TaxID=2916755 RepID=UPI0020A0BF2B|nr:polyphosphate polymerase domain-containing protein [Emticicia sp. 21SJ11W-3]UTA69787.1 polyphosphate polymerase domain-containing protein [Emticicia sp. 21SJ11W-3]